jgi:hypothetical protein
MLNPVVHSTHSGFAGAVRTAIKGTLGLNTVADDPAIAMVAAWGKRVNRAFETVEIMRFTMDGDFHRLIVIVSANFTFLHINSL